MRLTTCAAARGLLARMTRSHVGANARLLANVFTIALSVFAAWGWTTEVATWPPRLTEAGWLTLATITLVLQHLANASAALAERALRQRQRLTALAGAVLVLVFAGAVATGAEHAWAATERLRRLELTAPIASEIAALDADIETNRAALRSIPSDIPGSRIEILQAPLRDAIAQAEHRLEHLRAAQTQAPNSADASQAQLIFWLLAFAEPVLYWMLAAAERGVSQHNTASHPGVPPQQDGPSREPRDLSQVQRRRPNLRAVTGSALAALALFAPGAATPPELRRVGAGSVERFGTRVPRDPTGPGQEQRDRGKRTSLGRGMPAWWADAIALRATGLSYRLIARRLGVPKSTVGRWLKRAAEQGGS